MQICLGLVSELRTGTTLKAREGRPVRPGCGAAACAWVHACGGAHLQEVLWLLLGLCGLQGRLPGGGEAGLGHRLSHQQDGGRGAAAGGAHVCIWKHGLALWIPVWSHVGRRKQTFKKEVLT